MKQADLLSPCDSSMHAVSTRCPTSAAHLHSIKHTPPSLCPALRHTLCPSLALPLPPQIARKYGLTRQPKLVEMIAAVPEEHKAILLPQLRAKPVRTASGIAVVAVMSKPHRCPHIATTGLDTVHLSVILSSCLCWMLQQELCSWGSGCSHVQHPEG
jgi:hypothetical protein